MAGYNHKEIEPKWMKYWDENQTYVTVDPADWKGEKHKKFYGLIEFPYPSGEGLHVGHPRSYTAMDIIARKRRMNGYHVLYPIGFDAFGLPAENYAIKTKTHPKITTQKNIQRFTDQLKKLGFSFDWNRTVDTTDPEYYKWTQWIFLQLFKQGLAYKTEIAINWCLNCKIGLANEEVVQGRCERCGGPVEKRLKSQWMLAITKYAERLLNDLDTTEYLEKIKTQQREWIGRSEGVNYKQKVKDVDMFFESYDSVPQTFMAQTFAVIAPEHRLLAELVAGTEHEKPVLEFVEKIKQRKIMNGFEEDKEMDGIFTGRYLDNPFGTGDLPIWVASFVVADYGTGFVNCSAHDERDFTFAKKYNIPLRVAMLPNDEFEAQRVADLDYCYHHDPEGNLLAPEEFAGRKWGEVRKDMIEYIQKKGFGYPKVNYKLRDWVFSRQRYWGEPIPLVYCQSCANTAQKPALELSIYDQDIWQRIIHGEKSIETRALNPDEQERYFGNVQEGDIVLFINKITGLQQAAKIKKTWQFKNLGELSLATELHERIYGQRNVVLDELVKIHETFGKGYIERMNTNGVIAWEFELANSGEIMNPGWIAQADESLPLTLPDVPMYEPTDSGESPLANVTDWVETTCPKCGGTARRETDTMPNWAGSSWYFLRYIDPCDGKELGNMEKLKYWMEVDWYNGGMEHTTLHLLYSRFWNKFLYDIGVVPTSEPYMKRTSHGMILGEGGIKMSKSKGNVVNPDDIIEAHGADTLRLYEMFMGPFDQAIPWDSKGVEGCSRFIQRIWKLVAEKEKSEIKNEKPDDLERLLHKTIKKVGEDIDKMDFNTAISACMILLNDAQKAESLSKEFIEKFLIILSPFIPFISEELWEKLGHTESITLQPWPTYDEKLTIDDEVTIVVQINGKVRDSFTAPRDSAKEDLFLLSKEREQVKKWLEGKEVKKEIYVPNKMVSLVI